MFFVGAPPARPKTSYKTKVRGTASGRSTVVVRVRTSCASPAARIDSSTSSTCRARSPEARCGLPALVAAAMSARPTPRPASTYPALGGAVRHSSDSAVRTSTGSPKVCGSGTAIVPVSPYTSKSGTRVAQRSKDTVTVDTAPAVCSRIAVTVVSTPTGRSVPAAGPVAIVRGRVVLRAAPLTRSTGPSSVTSAVT